MQSIDSYMHVDPYSNDIKGKLFLLLFMLHLNVIMKVLQWYSIQH
jgi:hypothetical protein